MYQTITAVEHKKLAGIRPAGDDRREICDSFRVIDIKKAAMIIAIRFIFFFYQVKFSGSFASLERRFLLSELILFISSSESSKAATSRFSWR